MKSEIEFDYTKRAYANRTTGMIVLSDDNESEIWDQLEAIILGFADAVELP